MGGDTRVHPGKILKQNYDQPISGYFQNLSFPGKLKSLTCSDNILIEKPSKMRVSVFASLVLVWHRLFRGSYANMEQTKSILIRKYTVHFRAPASLIIQLNRRYRGQQIKVKSGERSALCTQTPRVQFALDANPAITNPMETYAHVPKQKSSLCV